MSNDGVIILDAVRLVSGAATLEATPAEVRADIAELTASLPRLPVLAVGNKMDLASQSAISNYQVAAANALEPSGRQPAAVGSHFVFISAGQRLGLDALQAALLAQVRGAGLASSGSATIVTNVRHARALAVAAEHLAAVRQGLDVGRGTELLAADLRHALGALGEITGEISSDDLLTSIFTQFCIGK